MIFTKQSNAKTLKVMMKREFENATLFLATAGVAQLVEHLICNQKVVGSIPTAGSIFSSRNSHFFPEIISVHR